MIVKTDAIVLQTRRFRESSKIVTFYTREFGKISAIARGAIQAKSKFGSALQPMSHVSAVIYRKEGRELENLSAAEPIERYGRLTESLERMSAGYAMIELVNAVMHDEDRSEPMFEALVDALRALNLPDVNETCVVVGFMIRLSMLLGYAIKTEECGICDEPVAVTRSSVAYSLTIGAPLCAEHRETVAYRALGAPAFELLRRLCRIEAEDAAMLDQSMSPAASELQDSLTSFIRFHVDGLRKLKVGNVSGKVLGATTL